MSKFKDLFNVSACNNIPIHNNEYVSNAHFLIKKSELKKNQLEFVNSFSMNDKFNNQIEQIIKSELDKNTVTEFKPERIYIDNEYNILIMNGVGINEDYYNFTQSLKCRIFIVESNTNYNPLSIYNSNNEFVGIVLPIRLNRVNLENSQDYNEYLEQLKTKQEAKEQSKQNSKKCLYISNNKAIVRNIELVNIGDLINNSDYNNLYMERNTKDEYTEIYLDLGIICIYVNSTKKVHIISEHIEYYLGNIKDFTLEIVLQKIRDQKNNSQFINVADIKLFELAKQNEKEIQELIDYRQNWYNRKAQEEQERREKKEQEDREYVEKQNTIAENLILKAEQAILNNETVKNIDITIYKSRYDSNTLSLILHMMKMNNIDVPLKTQGWINKALANIFYNDGEYSYQYYTSSKDSKVFIKYLDQLIKIIQNKYTKTITA